jgi:hypothetical protein
MPKIKFFAFFGSKKWFSGVRKGNRPIIEEKELQIGQITLCLIAAFRMTFSAHLRLESALQPFHR